MKNIFRIFAFATILALFFSCEKDNSSNCEAPDTIPMINNGPKIVGWSLEISAGSYGGTYKWITPSGGTMEQAGFVSTGTHSYRKDATNYNDSGLYRIEVKDDDGCLEYIASTQVKIITPPVAPCNIPTNSSTTTLGGVGGTNYSNISFGNNGNNILAMGANGETLNIRFAGVGKPREGRYTTVYGGTTSLFHASCTITKFPYDFNDMEGQDIYVNTINGKMQVSFCNNQFTNPLSSSIIRISAKITEP
jgi:hypothetical protein